MDLIISFFRDTLDGTTYVIVCSVSAVLLCACIGYLADKKSKKENAKEQPNNETTPPIPEVPMPNETTPTPAPLENLGVVENTVPQQPENMTMPTEEQQPEQLGEQIPQEQTYQPEQPQQTESVVSQQMQPQQQMPSMPEQMPIEQPQQMTPTPEQEQPIFPPVDNNVSPIGIAPSPVEATAPIEQPPVDMEQQAVPQINQEIQQPSPIIGENIDPNAQATITNPNLNINGEGIMSQPQQVTQPLPSATTPSMETANLDMPQMPVEGQQPVQAETLDNITEATEQIEEEQIIDNPVTTNVNQANEVTQPQPEPTETSQPQQAVPQQNVETSTTQTVQ